MLALQERWGLTHAFAEEVRWALASEAGTRSASLYALVNAVTRAAQALDPDERYRLERLAGRAGRDRPAPAPARVPRQGRSETHPLAAGVPGQPERVHAGQTMKSREEDEDALRAARPLLGRL